MAKMVCGRFCSSAFSLRTQLLCVQSPFPLSSLFTKRKVSFYSVFTNGNFFLYKTAPFAVVKFWIANWSIIPCESSSSVSPVSSTSTHPPKLELQIICKHEKKLLETILATQRTDRDKISPPRHDSWGPRIKHFWHVSDGVTIYYSANKSKVY